MKKILIFLLPLVLNAVVANDEEYLVAKSANGDFGYATAAVGQTHTTAIDLYHSL
ncbi:hypothetical protein AGMMS50229_10310 [Campylobacterota bacterium]|nr:hypothetical protein AGMMS50229_10310 [Campylobacterota bacterium]